MCVRVGVAVDDVVTFVAVAVAVVAVVVAVVADIVIVTFADCCRCVLM